MSIYCKLFKAVPTVYCNNLDFILTKLINCMSVYELAQKVRFK